MAEQINDARQPNGSLPSSLLFQDDMRPPIGTHEEGQSSDDYALALALQQLEDEDMVFAAESRNNMRNPHAPTFEKVGVVSRYNSSTMFSHRSFPSSKTASTSGDYKEALQKEAELKELGADLKGGGMAMMSDGTVLTKHDAQLNGLANASKLSEIEGVGDLQGAGILLSNSVANELKSWNNSKRG